jgi:hypothetical protein
VTREEMMRARIRDIVGLAGVLAAAASIVGAHTPVSAEQQVFTPAGQCMWLQPSSAALAWTDGSLRSNSMSNTPWLTCGLDPASPDEGVRNVLDVHFQDFNPQVGWNGNVHCHATRSVPDHSSMLIFGTRYGCATPGGCASNPGSFEGEGYIRFTGFAFDRSAHTFAVTCRLPPIHVVMQRGVPLPLDFPPSRVRAFVWSAPEAG